MALAWLGVALVGATVIYGKAKSDTVEQAQAGPGGPQVSTAVRPAPDFAGTALDGRPVSLREFRGRPLVVNFFADWCVPCKDEASGLARFQRTYAGRAGFIAMAIDSQIGDVRAFVRRYGWTRPVLMDPGYRWSSRFRVIGKPTTFVIDRRGRIVRTFLGRTPEHTLARAVDRLLT